MNYVKAIYIRNPGKSKLTINAVFKSGQTKTINTSENETKVKGQLTSKKMVTVDPVKSIEIVCEEKDYREKYEMEDVSGIETRYYSVSHDLNGGTCVLMSMK
jgi:hypothetical protein